MDPGAGSLTRRKRYELRGASRADDGCRDVDASPRFLFYSNECVGLGHLRRCLRLARGLTEADPRSSALIVTGSPVATSYSLPPRVDLVKLPALARDEEGNHLPERLAIDVDDGLAGPLAPRRDRRVRVRSHRGRDRQDPARPAERAGPGARAAPNPLLPPGARTARRRGRGREPAPPLGAGGRARGARALVRHDPRLRPEHQRRRARTSRLGRSRHPHPSRRIRRSAGRPSRPRRPAARLSPGDRGRRRRRLPAAVAVRRGPAPAGPSRAPPSSLPVP